jgi:spermidine synthase
MTDPAERLVLAAVVVLGFSCMMTQLALLRESMSAFAGNEMVLGVVLGLWLLLMGMGAWLGRYFKRLGSSLRTLVVIQILVALLPLCQVFLLRALRNVVFIRGADVGVSELVVAVCLLLLPYCLVSGYGLTLACSILAQEKGPAAIGRVYIADSLGGIAGGILFSFVLSRFLDHSAILVFPACLSLLAAAAVAFRLRKHWLVVACIALGIAVSATAVLVDLDGWSLALQYRPQRILARANSPYGKLLVTGRSGQIDLFENGVPMTSTRDDQHLEETVHFAMAQRPHARKVLLIGGGFSGTAMEILKYGVGEVDYVELDPALLALGVKYLPQNLGDSRIRVHNTDGRLFIKQAKETYDVVILDLPPPATAQLNRFYTAEFFQEIHRALAAGGVVAFGLAQYENFVSPELARMLASARLTLARSFSNTLLLPGSRVFFLASDGPLYQNIAQRLEERQMRTKLMNPHYLDAMLAPDRMADIDRATSRPAELNQDFNPMLYFYHLRHWLSQFDTRFGVAGVMLLLLPTIYLLRLRGCSVVLAASGFAASALEMVLLLGFQVTCGSVYHQVGVIVTLFMAGLALGAWVSGRHCPVGFAAGRPDSRADFRSAVSQTSSLQGPVESDRPRDSHDFLGVQAGRGPALQRTGGLRYFFSAPPGKSNCARRDGRTLAFLALGIATYAMVLPLLLPQLARIGATPAALVLTKVLIAFLALGLAVLVGMQFPLANRLEFDGTARTASRLYAADFAGSFLGALLGCTLLIPLIGVAGVCWLTAGLNLFAGAVVVFRKVVA